MATASRPTPRPGVLEIEAYVPGKSAAPAGVKLHKLSSNETPLGPSPKAVAAFEGLVGKLEFYPDGSSSRLKQAIAGRYGLDPARIICGNGSDELLALLAHVFLHPGEEGLYSQYGFLTYPICIRAAGGIPVVAEETENGPAEPIAFRTAPGQGVNIGRNVWHGILTPLDKPSDFAVVDRGGEGVNLEEHFYEEAFLIR